MRISVARALAARADDRGAAGVKVGFVGGSGGMTRAQGDELRSLLELARARELHHGDRVGADEQAVAIASELGLRVVAHPPAHDRGRARLDSDETCPTRPAGRRNADIVSSTDLLLAAPNGPPSRRSEVWTTVRRACDARRPHVIVWPNGSLACGPRDTLGCFLIRDEALMKVCEHTERFAASGDPALTHTCA